MTPEPISMATLLKALRWRYATKAFDPQRKIPPDTWAALEDALVLSASSFGLQPYRFFVVVDPAVRQQLLPHAWGQRQVVDASHLVVFAARTSVTEAEIDTFIRRLAQTRQVSVESLAAYRSMMTDGLLAPTFQPLARHWTARQAYLALGNLLTCAALLGVDACPMEGFDPAGFDRVLGLEAQGLTAVVCCALGYRRPDDKYAALPKFRFTKSELIKTI
jgi:nitroreductase